MSAKRKLNAAYFNGALLTAAVVGCITGSWIAFFMALVFFIGINIHTRCIR